MFIQLVNYPDYLVSEEGVVISLSTGWKNQHQIKNNKGEMRVNLKDPNGKLSNLSVKRLVMEAFYGPSDLYVIHKNKIKTDNRLENLQYKKFPVLPVGNQICRVCQENKDLKNYGVYKNRNKMQYRRMCNQCRVLEERERYNKNPEYAVKMKERARIDHLKKNYGITEDDYQKMFKEQNGKCAICFKDCPKKINIDHCHKTGKVRGLLCWNCNLGIGYFKDNPEILESASHYLKFS